MNENGLRMKFIDSNIMRNLFMFTKTERWIEIFQFAV